MKSPCVLDFPHVCMKTCLYLSTHLLACMLYIDYDIPRSSNMAAAPDRQMYDDYHDETDQRGWDKHSAADSYDSSEDIGLSHGLGLIHASRGRDCFHRSSQSNCSSNAFVLSNPRKIIVCLQWHFYPCTQGVFMNLGC